MKRKSSIDQDISTVIKTLRHAKEYSGQSILVKIGGSALKDPNLVTSFCQDLALIRSIGISVFLVHGGGASISEELHLRGIKSEFLEGQRVTTNEMIDVIEMVLCGKMNRRIVRTLNASGIKAIGLSGSDAGMLLCRRFDPRLQNVGIIEQVDTAFLSDYIQKNEKQAIPVISPVGIDESGNALNINADWVACRIAETMGIKELIYLTDQPGILDKNGHLIPELTVSDLERLISEQVVTGGMLAKSKTILYALRKNVQNVHIINSMKPHSLIEELFTQSRTGTLCKMRSIQNPVQAA